MQPAPIANSIAAMADELTAWRRDMHTHPELGYEEHRTAGLVAERLAAFGVDEIETGIAGTGVMAVIRGRGEGPTIMFRADMDALPITEATGAPYASATPGVMHACGHDGHTTMLLGAARHLAETRNFAGTVCLCFQPAEEGGAGAKAMIEDGLLARYRPQKAFGMHNWPGVPVGHFAVTDDRVMAAAHEFTIRIDGRGGHAAWPHLSRDPLLAGAHLVTALQSVVSRRIDPLDPAVLSVTRFDAGTTHNVIPAHALLQGTTRSFSEAVTAETHGAMEEICRATGAAFGVTIEIEFGSDGYPATINDPGAAAEAARAMKAIVGENSVTVGHVPAMAGEDFSFFAREMPAAYVLIGNGETPPLHHPAYDFDDSAAPYGVAFWVKLAETVLPLD